MFRKTFLCLAIFALAYLISGCGIRPQVDFYVNPVSIGDQYKVDERSGSVIYEDDDIYVKVTPVDVVNLMNIASESYANPYIYVNDWGKARQRYTVFDVTVRNKRDSEISVQPVRALLMDDQGEQYEAFPLDELRERYDYYPRVEREVVYQPQPRFYRPTRYYRRGYYYNPWYYNYDINWVYRPTYVRRVYDVGYIRRAVLKGTMLSKVNLYSGGKREGFLVFPLLEPESVELKLILPAFISYKDRRGNIQEKKLEFHFKKVPA